MAKKLIKRPWTKDDMKALRDGAKKGIGAPAIAKMIKRTEGAVRQMAFDNKISLRIKNEVQQRGRAGR